MRPYRLILSLLAALLTPRAALAQMATLGCINGAPVPGTHLYATACPGVMGMENIFSSLACNFQSIMDQVLSYVYCGAQNALVGPLQAAITAYVVIFGVQFMLGHVQATLGEAMMRIVKISLILMFAMNSAWGIGYAYNFFITAMQSGVGWALESVMPGIVPPGSPYTTSMTFAYFDTLLYGLITGPFTAQGARLAGFIAVLSYIIPPVFMMYVYFSTKSIAILIRALLSYLLGISAIAFLMALSPIFLSFALFRPTYRFFDDWLRYIISFTLQIVLIFAGVALWLNVVSQLGTFFTQLSGIIVPVQQIAAAGAVQTAVDSFGICPFTSTNTPLGPVLTCIPGMDPLLPSALVQQGSFVYFLSINLLALCTVVYCFDTLIKMLPNLARQLAGPSYAPALGGGNVFGQSSRLLGGFNFPGSKLFESVREKVERETSKGVGGVVENLRGAAGKARRPIKE